MDLASASQQQVAAALPLALPTSPASRVEVQVTQLGRPYCGDGHENYLLRLPGDDGHTVVPIGLETAFTVSGRACKAVVESGKYGPLFAVTDTQSGRTIRKEKPPERPGKNGATPNSSCLLQLGAELMAHLSAETGTVTKFSGAALFGLAPHQGGFRAFLNTHFQPQPANGKTNGSGGGVSGEGATIPAMYATSSSEPASPAHSLPVAGKSLSAEVGSSALPPATASKQQSNEPPETDARTDGTNSAGSDLPNGKEVKRPSLNKDRFGILAKRLQGIRAPEGPPPEDPWETSASEISLRPVSATPREAEPRRGGSGSTHNSGDMADMPFDRLPAHLQSELAALRVTHDMHQVPASHTFPSTGSPTLRIRTKSGDAGSSPGAYKAPAGAMNARALGIAARLAGTSDGDGTSGSGKKLTTRTVSQIDEGLPQDVKQVGEYLRAALEASAAADDSGRTRQWQLLACDENGVKLGLLAIDARGFERTVVLARDLSWEVDVFGMPILDTVLRNQQVPRRLRTRRDLLTLLAGAAELAVCPGCPDRNTWTDLAGDADALYAPDGATIVARVETNSFVAVADAAGDPGWRCDWTVRPQTYLAEGPLEGEGSEAGGEGVPVQGCHMLVPGSDPCTACRRFAGDLSARLQELMGEEDGPADFQDERERLAAANAQRNIERLRQQVEEIKEQEANYDPSAALAMAMFEHSEGGRGGQELDPLLRLWAERRQRATRSACGVLNNLTSVIENTRSETATALIFQTSEVLSINFNLEEDEVLFAYVNLLKAISMKLTPGLVGLFFHVDEDGTASFPLYTEAVKFIAHRAAPVRAAVRTLTLNMYAIEEPEVQAFLAGDSTAFFTDLGAFMTDRCQALDKALVAMQNGAQGAPQDLEDLLGEVETCLSYWNDILCTGEPALCNAASEKLWKTFLAPVVFYPLAAGDMLAAGPDSAEAAGVRRMSVNNWARTWLPSAEKGRVRPLASLYILERVFHVMTEGGVLNPLLAALLGGGSGGGPSLTEFRFDTLESGDAASAVLTPAIQRAIGHEAAAYRLAIFGILHGSDAQVVGALVRALTAALLNEAVDVEILDCCGMLPPQSMQPVGRQHGEWEDSGPPNPFSRGSPVAHADVAFSTGPETSALAEDLIDALCGLLLLPFMPATALWHIGWLLRQLLPASPGGGPRLTDQQCGLLESAMRLSRQFLMAELNGMWCDAMLTLIHVEWPRARDHLMAPATSSAHAVVQAWMQATQVQDLMGARALSGSIAEGGGPPTGEGASATAAKRMVQAVQQFVAMLQIQQTLLADDGEIQEAPMLFPVDEELLEEMEVREGQPIERTERVPCTIALAKGKSRKVFFAVAGLPRDRRNFDGTPSDEAVVHALPVVVIVDDSPGSKPVAPAVSPPRTPERPPEPTLTANLNKLTQKGAKRAAAEAEAAAAATAATAVAKAGPHTANTEIQVASNGTSVHLSGRGQPLSANDAAVLHRASLDVAARPNLHEVATGRRPLSRSSSRCGSESPAVKPGGTVLSVAPLMGTEPDSDAVHAQWLHVHVRPPVRALLKVLKNSSVGDAFSNIGRQLKDGHWVLSFPSPEAASYATLVVDQAAAKLRAYLIEVMAPLLVHQPQGQAQQSHVTQGGMAFQGLRRDYD